MTVHRVMASAAKQALESLALCNPSQLRRQNTSLEREDKEGVRSMQWFQNQKTMTKLAGVFGLLATLIGVVGYMGIRGMSAFSIIIMGASAICLAVGMGYWVAKMIATPLGQAVTVLRAVVTGDLTLH